MAIAIRKTTPSDTPLLHALHETTFGELEGGEVADLTLALLRDPSAQPVLSLAAWDDAELIGHVLFTRVSIDGMRAEARILAPLAVTPGFQGRGIGGELVREGFAVLREAGCELVFVLGHPEYYPRFGFAPALPFGLMPPQPIGPHAGGAWMVTELQPGTLEAASPQTTLPGGGNALDAIAGRRIVRCADALSDAKHWAS